MDVSLPPSLAPSVFDGHRHLGGNFIGCLFKIEFAHSTSTHPIRHTWHTLTSTTKSEVYKNKQKSRMWLGFHVALQNSQQARKDYLPPIRSYTEIQNKTHCKQPSFYINVYIYIYDAVIHDDVLYIRINAFLKPHRIVT